MFRKEAHHSLTEAESSSLEPRTGETPQGYLRRLAQEVYTGDLQGSLLEAFGVCFRIARVGATHVIARPRSNVSRVEELFVPESLASARARCDEEIRAGKALDFFDYPVTLQPEAAAEAVYALNHLRGRLMKKPSTEFNHTSTTSTASIIRKFLEPLPGPFWRDATYRVSHLGGDQLIARGMDTGKMEQELVGGCQSLVKSIGIERRVTLGSFQDMVLLLAEMFEGRGIDGRVWDHTLRLTDEYYQLGS